MERKLSYSYSNADNHTGRGEHVSSTVLSADTALSQKTAGKPTRGAYRHWAYDKQHCQALSELCTCP